MTDNPVTLALEGIFRTRNSFDYEVTKSVMPYDGIILFTIGPYLEEKYGVATSREVAVEYADLLLTDRLEHETDTFDGEWLLRFTPDYSEDVLIGLPGEGQKHKYIKEHGVNVKAAIRDMKAAHRNNIDHWLETVFNAFTCTLKTTSDGLVYWRRG
jgi:hypothetical protein